jgi:cold shock CspA family protein
MEDKQNSSRDREHARNARVSGIVKWFHVKNGYGFIIRSDTGKDVFVHRTAIVRNNPRKAIPSLGDGEAVEFFVTTTTKGERAVCVSGPNWTKVRGSKFARGRRRRGYRNRPTLHQQSASCSDDGGVSSSELSRFQQQTTADFPNSGKTVSGSGTVRQSDSDTVAKEQSGFVCRACYCDLRASGPNVLSPTSVTLVRPVPAPRRSVPKQATANEPTLSVSNAAGQRGVRCVEPQTVGELHQWIMDVLNVRKSGYPRDTKYDY